MIISRGDLKTAVLKAMGLVRSNADDVIIADIENRINVIQDYISLKRDWQWRQKDYHLTTREPFTTGTIEVTKGSRTITGTGTGWSQIVEQGYIKIHGKVYKVHEFVSSTSIKLPPGAGYPDASESGLTYEIVYPFYFLHPEISSIVNVFNDTDILRCTSQNRLVLSTAATGKPREAYIGTTQHKTYYSTGTVTVNGTTTVTGSGTAWTSDMEGMPFQVDEFGEIYVIDTVTDDTTLVLNKAYRGESGAGKSYTIGKVGSPLIGFRYIPDDSYYLTIEALRRIPSLEDDAEFSLIPDHGPLFHGCLYYAYTVAEKKDPFRVQQELANFKESLQQLENTYKAVGGTQWQSETEQRARNNFGLTEFDPLNQLLDRF